MKLSFVDVGAAGGLEEPWKRHASKLDVTLIEPSPKQAAILRRDCPNARVIEAALFNSDGEQTLNIARMPGCSSLLPPNAAILEQYHVAPCFEVMRREQVRCVRYDTLFREGEAPVPEAIKIDVQGAEMEVLEGFGELLDQTLAIMLEAQLYEIYEGQKLLHDLVTFLGARGLYIRAILPHQSFDAELVELDAVFVRRRRETPPELHDKLALAEMILEVPEHPLGRRLAEKHVAKTSGRPADRHV